jgi:uncharacterized protein YcfL
MKKLFAISAAVALAAFTMTGCNPTGSTTSSQNVKTETETVTNGVTTTTEYEYDETGLQISETQYVNNRLVYKIGAPVNGINGSYRTTTRTRTSYNEDGSVSTHTLLYSYGSTLTEYQVTDEDGNVIELEETRYVNNGGILDVSELKHTVDGVVVLNRTNYDYTNYTNSQLSPYYTYTERKDGGEPVSMRFIPTYKIPGGYADAEYEIRAGWESDSDKGILVETLSDYESDQIQMEVSYQITKYDANGSNPVKTFVTDKYETITVTL